MDAEPIIFVIVVYPILAYQGNFAFRVALTFVVIVLSAWTT
jgi:hypothetical protein